jgi:hypothetical protein
LIGGWVGVMIVPSQEGPLMALSQSRVVGLVFGLVAAAVPYPVQARQVLLVANVNTGTVAKYDPSTGAVIDANFLTGLNGPYALAVDANNRLFVDNGNNLVGVYDARTGAVINATLLQASSGIPGGIAVDNRNHLFQVVGGPGPSFLDQFDATTGSFIKSLGGYQGALPMAVDAGNHLFVGDTHRVGEYDAATLATINANFITDQRINPLGLLLDGKNHLFLNNSNSISEYDATTGAVLNADFVNVAQAFSFTVDDDNHLFVSRQGGIVGEYDATTGAPINTQFITGVPGAVLFLAPVPEPSSLLLVTAAAAIGVRLRRRR